MKLPKILGALRPWTNRYSCVEYTLGYWERIALLLFLRGA